MENLTLLEQEALGILKHLEFSCAQFELGGGRKENGLAKGVEIPVNNIEITPLLKKAGGLDLVERFLQSNRLNFSTSFDLIKRPFRFPDGTITENTVFGIIKGENIQDINTKIKKLINKINDTTRNAKEEERKKYYDANEDIFLKTLGIKIKGNYIIRGQDKKKINPTDKSLIYFLYFKLKNADECFSLKDLSETEEIKRSERYIKNRITIINQSIRKIISPILKKLKIGRFIKNELGRGYHLNPRILLIKPKK